MKAPIRFVCTDLCGRADTQLVRIIGDLDLTNSRVVFDAFIGCVADGKRFLVLDCSALHSITSAGAGALVYLNELLRLKTGGIRLAALNKGVREVMELIGAAVCLEMYDSVDEAMESLRALSFFQGASNQNSSDTGDTTAVSRVLLA